jgi:hypothetical protein
MLGVNSEEIDKALSKLPQKEKEEYLAKTMQKYWEKIEVVAVSNTGINWIEPGDVAMGNSAIINEVMPLPIKEYMLVRESLIKAVY